MLVSVAICTWNRAKLLDRTLGELRKLRIPSGVEWELLVVNNNSTDHTAAVIEKQDRLLPIRSFLETRPGLSNARNCAIKHAQGDLLIWTDDDVLVDSNWLAAYVEAAQQFPNATFFGGTIDPWFAVPPPRWITNNLDGLVGPLVIRRFDSHVRPLAPTESPFGANMAFRTDVLRSVSFDPRLGRVEHQLTSDEETDLLCRLRADGHAGVWVGNANVSHYIPPERLTAEYIRRWFVAAGRTYVIRQGLANCTRVLNVPRYLIREYLTERTRTALFSVSKGRRWFQAFKRSAMIWGMMMEARKAPQLDKGSVISSALPC